MFGTLKHLVFFETLAETKEGSQEWNSTTAGLVVLRLLDTWVDLGAQSLRENARGVRNVRAAIDEVAEGSPYRKLLHGILDSVERAEHPDMTAILPRLMAYGRILDYESHWRLANDVYQTVLDYTSQEQDAEMVIDAHMQMGYGSRMLGEWEDAAQSYAAAGQIASAHGDIPRVLRSRIADAKLAIDRGNLPHAELLLDDTIEQSRTDEGLSEIRSLALHERAAVAYMRGQFESSVKIAYDALRGMRNATARDRVLADIASCFAELGVLSAARDALVIVAATAQEAYLRWVAEINLLELSARLRSETAFEMYRRALHGAELPASLEANYHLHVGRGYQHFGKFDQAKAALKRAVEVAAKHKFNQLVFEAEKSLGEIERGVAGEEVVAGEAVGEVKEIAEAITEMRVAAGLPD